MADKTKTSAENQKRISTAGFKSAAHLVGFADGSAGAPGVLRSASPGIRSRGR